MAQTMRAAFLDSTRTITIREVPVPDPGPADALLRVTYCGICGSDLSVFKTGALAGPDAVLGHEIIATVEVDPTGTHASGARVAVFPPRGCGECMWCREGHQRYCVDKPHDAWGGYAQYATYPVRNLIPVPADVDDRAAAMADPLGVGLRAVEIADPKQDDVAYVNGLGPIGLFTAAALAARGVTVIGGDPVAERREMGTKVGVSLTIDPSRDDPYETSLDYDPHGPGFAFECSGTVDGLQQIFDACGHMGMVGILGIPMGPVLLLRMTIREQRAFSIAGPTRESMEAALRHVAEHPETAAVVTGTIGMDDLQQTMDGLIAHSAGVKVLLDPWA